MTPFRTHLFLAAALLLPPTLSAQGWRVEAAAGRAVHDPVSARINSTVGSVGLSYDGGPARWLYLSAGAPLGDPGPAWGAGGAGGWLGLLERGPFTLGATLGLHAFGYGASTGVSSGGGATLEALPTLAWAAGERLRAELSAGVVGTADLAGDSSVTRGVLESGARLVYAAAEGIELAADGRYLRADGEDWPYAGASAAWERGRYGAWAFAGQWLGSDTVRPRTAYGAGVRYGVDRRTRVELLVRQEPSDPVYRSTPRRTWSLQVSRAVGPVREDAPGPGRAPYSLLPRVAGGMATFHLSAVEHPGPVVLIGDFTGWQPVAMTRSGGLWFATVAVRPGAHHYAFRTADGTIVVPPGAPTVDDGFGGRSAVLVVP